MKRLLPVGIVCLVTPLVQAATLISMEVSHQPQLFLDDHLVVTRTNLKREIERPTKHPANPLIVQDLPWERRLIATYGTVLYDEVSRRFRCWYTAGEYKDGIPDNPEHPITAEYFICYAESEDGIHWEKPLVGQRKFGLHEKHNIVIPKGHGFCVLLTPKVPDVNKRFRGAGGDLFGFSPDGITWTTHNWRDAVGKNDTSSSVVSWKGEYLAYVRYQVKDPRWPGVMRGIGRCVSRDFENWTPKELIFRTDEKDGYPWTQPYGMAVTSYGDQLIGILWLLHLDEMKGNNSLGDEDTQLVVSRDGRNWQRVAHRATFLAPTPRTWDQGRIHAPATSMFIKDDVVHIYYSASDTRHGSGSWGTPGVGLATLPADRFVALRLRNPAEVGVLETPLLKFSGTTLLVNAKVEEADLHVELLDSTGAVMQGFGRSNSRLVTHDTLRYRVVWDSHGEEKCLGDVPGSQAIALRFILNKGALYAFQITPSAQRKTRFPDE